MKLTCIVCPIGCSLEVLAENKAVKGAGCKRGEKYAIEECTCPKRILTTTVKISKSEMLSVKSDKPLPKDKLIEFMEIINSARVYPPVNIGDIIIKNIYDNVNIVATKNIR